MKINKLIAALSFAASAALAPGIASAVPVALELALLVDVSGSVSASEYDLQKNGYVNAFNNAALIANLPVGGVAVTYIEWASGNQQSQLVGWSLITDAASASAFAAAVSGTSRAFSGSTGPGSAINFAVPLFTGNGFEGDRLVIDVSGDGAQNSGSDTSDARDAALAAGVDTINGIAIGGAQSVEDFYQNNIVGGTNGFLLAADTFEDFQSAILTKLQIEIGGCGGPNQPPCPAPEPGALPLAGIALLGMTFMLRRRRLK